MAGQGQGDHEAGGGRGVFTGRAPRTARVFAGLSLEIKLAPGQPPSIAAQTMKDAEQTHEKFPLSRGITRQYAEAMIAGGKLEQAAAYLREQVRRITKSRSCTICSPRPTRRRAS